jgi:hypothetical protein
MMAGGEGEPDRQNSLALQALWAALASGNSASAADEAYGEADDDWYLMYFAIEG